MITIDSILLEWSYRCNDGVVNLNNPQKKAILEQVLSELGIDLNEALNSKATSLAIDNIINSELGKKYNFKKQSDKYRLGNLDKITKDQFVDIINNLYDNPSIKINGPKESPNPSSKYSMFEFETPNGVANIILSGGANEGEKYEQNFLGLLKSLAGTPLEDIDNEDAKKLFQSVNIDPSTLTDNDIVFAGASDTKRPLSFEGPQNIGKIIADIIIKPDTYLSIKNKDGSGIYNGGIVPFITMDKEGNAAYDDTKLNNNPIIKELFDDLNIDPEKIVIGINDYINDTNNNSNTYETLSNINATKLKNFISSAYGYGYYYVREKDKKLFIYPILTAEDAYKLVGDVKDVRIKYANNETKTTTIKISTESEILGSLDYIIEIRNTQGKILPLSLKIKSSK
jgi:hypothetical protein